MQNIILVSQDGTLVTDERTASLIVAY